MGRVELRRIGGFKSPKAQPLGAVAQMPKVGLRSLIVSVLQLQIAQRGHLCATLGSENRLGSAPDETRSG